MWSVSSNYLPISNIPALTAAGNYPSPKTDMEKYICAAGPGSMALMSGKCGIGFDAVNRVEGVINQPPLAPPNASPRLSASRWWT